MRTAKLCATVCTLSFAAMVLGAHETRQLFPWVHGFAFISATTLLVGVFFGRLSTVAITVITIMIAVTLRVFIFEWPASMIGLDPAKYAVGIHQIIISGNLVELKQVLPTYGVLSAFHFLNSTVAIVSGFGGRNVLIAIPILIGALFPLTAITLTSHHTHSSIAIGLSGVIATIAATGVSFGFRPIVQAIAVLLWCVEILLLSRFIAAGHKRDVVVLFVLVLASVFAHKLSMFVLTGAVGIAILIRYIRIGELLGRRPATDNGRIRTEQSWIIWLLLSIGLTIQWTILTTFVEGAVIRKGLALLTGGVSVVSNSGEVHAAVPANQGIIDFFIRPGSFLILTSITAIASFILWFRDNTWPTCVLLGATLIPAMIAGISIIGVTVAGPQRAIIFGIPIFAAVLGISVTQIADQQSTSQILVVFVVALVVITSQAGSATLAPDYPGEPRFYLTNEEATAMTFMTEHAPGPVAMDHYYGGDQVDLDDPSNSQKPGRYQVPGKIGLDDELSNATLLNKSYGTILLRKTGVIRFSGGAYRLTWNPIRVLTNHDRYNRVFDNGPVVGFDNSSVSPN